MKFLLWYIERHDYKAQLDVADTFASKYYEENLSFLEENERLKKENKKLRSENHALKCRIRKKKRENRKPIIDKALKMEKELAVEVPFMGEVNNEN